jgi:hypothetical protein
VTQGNTQTLPGKSSKDSTHRKAPPP